MILVVFHTAGINEKKNILIMKKKIFGTELGWATAQVSLRLGWALGAGRAGAGRAGTALAAWARGRGAHGRGAHGRGAHGRWGGRRWGALGAAGIGARSAGERASGRLGAAGSWQARARQGAAGARTRHGLAGARGRRRQGRAGRPAGRPVRAWCAQLGQVWCFAAPDSVFGLVRLGIFPESPNEHCSL